MHSEPNPGVTADPSLLGKGEYLAQFRVEKLLLYIYFLTLP